MILEFASVQATEKLWLVQHERKRKGDGYFKVLVSVKLKVSLYFIKIKELSISKP